MKIYRQDIIDTLLNRLDTANCEIKTISLTAEESAIRDRLVNDVLNGVCTKDVIERSIERIPLYQNLDTVKIDTTARTICEIADEIMKL